MVRSVTFDTLELAGANIWIDLGAGAIRLELGYTLKSSGSTVSLARRREVQEMLLPEERAALLGLAQRLGAPQPSFRMSAVELRDATLRASNKGTWAEVRRVGDMGQSRTVTSKRRHFV